MILFSLLQQNPILVKALVFINETNPSNDAPYHGIDHLFTVFRCAADVTEYNKTDKRTELLLAALFHDYDHAGKMGDDHANIEKAIAGLDELNDTTNALNDVSNMFNIEFVKDLIRATEYPYVVEDKDLTNEAKILRDADMSYMFEDISFVKLYNGLRTEFGQDLQKFCEGQEKFLSSLKFHDAKLQERWSTAIKPIRIAELRLLMENI